MKEFTAELLIILGRLFIQLIEKINIKNKKVMRKNERYPQTKTIIILFGEEHYHYYLPKLQY